MDAKVAPKSERERRMNDLGRAVDMAVMLSGRAVPVAKAAVALSGCHTATHDQPTDAGESTSCSRWSPM